jgi:tetratricopeptide (TPR) repeat protein
MTLTPVRENGASRSGACLDAELLASYVDGRATAAERAKIEEHLVSCEDCYFVFSETVQESRSPKLAAGFAAAAALVQGRVTTRESEDVHRWRLSHKLTAGFAVAAALVLVAQVVIVRIGRPEAQLKIALNQLETAAAPYRKYQPRLTITPTHHQLEPAMRSAGQPEEAPLAVREAARRVERAATALGAGVEGQRARAAMYLTLGRAQGAADALAPLAQSNDAGLLSDIAATYLSRQASGDVKRALDLLERAVSLDPNRAEAWFNLGLAAEAADEPTRAEEAWTRALALDSQSGWAGEARAHLERLKKPRRAP